MRRVDAVRFWGSVLLVMGSPACGEGTLVDDTVFDTGEVEGTDEPVIPPTPPLRNAVDLEDGVLAYEALVLMGHEPLGATGQTCSECHSITQGQIEAWRQMTVEFEQNCLEGAIDSRERAASMVDCLKQKPDIEESPFDTPRLGIYAAAAHLDYFDHVFDVAFSDASDEQADFMRRVSMPRPPGTPWTQSQFDIVAEWFARGTPFVGEFLPASTGAGACSPDISPDVAVHIDRMAVQGWRAVNESNNLLMFGCAEATEPRDCLSTYGASPAWAHLPGSTVRVLRTNRYSSSFWTRSSADGRFVGHGGGPGGSSSTIVDLAEDREIPVDGLYDPAFFPDNSAFMWQGTGPGGTGICSQDVLDSGISSVTFTESQCSRATQVGLYQHVGRALDGGDYWTVNGSFVSDNGGISTRIGNPSAWFDDNAVITLTPMVFSGGDYVPKSTSRVSVPFEGDTVISRSSELLVSRIAGSGSTQDGLSLRRIDATPTETGYDVQAPVIATYCVNGGKPDISFDDRWMVLHTYIDDTDESAQELGFSDRNDPGFAQYRTQGAANLYLVDLRTSLSRRITSMGPGEYALFPHFRSDGWIYFVVRTRTSTEYIAASDAALVLEE